jgi:succinoglycan biosynthesis transport protein ExoP
MSRLHRAVEKAEREGLMTWTQSPGDGNSAAAVADVAPSTVPADVPREPYSPPLPPIGRLDTLDQVPSGDGLSRLFVAAHEPSSLAAEQYRLLRTRLEGGDLGRRTRLLLVTSARIGDGKTTTSANLALTMAHTYRDKIALVEADLRRPALATLFGVRAEPGLSDVLLGAASLDDALVQIPEHHLFVLPAGLAATRSTELLASSAMERLVTGLRARFTRVVIDTPPMTLADTHVLSRLADGVLMVIRVGITPRPAVERALAGLNREKLVGVVLNEVDESTGDYGYSGAEYAYRPQLQAQDSRD